MFNAINDVMRFFFFFFLLKCDDRKHDFAVNRAVESETRLKVAKWNLDIFHIPFLIWWLNHFHTHLFPLSLSVLVVPNKRTGASCARHICRLYSLSLSLTFAVCLCYWLIVDWLRKAEIKHERIQAIATSLRTHEQENKLFFQIVCFLPDFVESRIFVQRPIHVSVDCFFFGSLYVVSNEPKSHFDVCAHVVEPNGKDLLSVLT